MKQSNFDKFLEKAEEIRMEKQLEGASVAEQEKAAADYFGMCVYDYRLAKSAARQAKRAQQKFTILYYCGTHPDVSTADIAKALLLPEVQVKTILENG